MDSTQNTGAPENTGGKQGNGRFAKGESGNPRGRPRGSRNKASLLAEAMLAGDAEALMRKAIELAKGGDGVALRLCLERLLPIKRERVITIDLLPINSAADAKEAMAAIIAGVAGGELSPSEASQVSELIDTYVRAAQTTDLEKRVEELEREYGSKK
jgi:uncharacterized protein DUF5681